MHRVDAYQEKLSKLQGEEKQIRSRLARILLLRLITFALMVAGIWVLASIHYGGSIAVGVLGMISFLWLVKINANVRNELDLNLKTQELNQGEVQAQNADFSFFNGGVEYRAIEHPYAYDLDLFGDNSFFQSLNRSSTFTGERLLADLVNDIVRLDDDLTLSHNISKELADKLQFRQRFFVYGRLYGSSKNELDGLKDWKEEFKKTVNNSIFWKTYMYLMPALAIAALVLNIIGLLSILQLLMFLLIPLAITSMRLGQTNQKHAASSEQYDTLKKAGKLLELVENEEFKSQDIISKKSQLINDGWKSADIGALGKVMASFDNRLNPIMGTVLNAFFAWDFHCVSNLEKWMDKYSKNFNLLYQQLAWWDVQVSLSTYHYNHPHFNFPELSENIVEAKEIGHPFLPDDVCVKNDFSLNRIGEFNIITGANMAGKSTFLRTIGLSLIMARIGLPIYANSYKFSPIRIYTSMRTTDSLQENESYFYTELKRLKAITNELQKGEKLFVILDEILKGTNSKDKAEGSKRFVKKLLRLNVVGIIATHDLSLTSLGEEEAAVTNLCFEVEFGENDLIFDYKLKPGVCKNMNATWLLEKMELV